MEQKQLRDAFFKLPTDMFLLILPVLFSILWLVLWGQAEFLWTAPLLGGMGWILMWCSVYFIVPSSTQLMALQLYYVAMMTGVALCSVLIPLKDISSLPLLKPHAPETSLPRAVQDNRGVRGPTQKDLEQLCVRLESLEQVLQKFALKEKGTS